MLAVGHALVVLIAEYMNYEYSYEVLVYFAFSTPQEPTHRSWEHLYLFHYLYISLIYTPKNELCSSIAANYGPNGLHPSPSFPISDCPTAVDARAIPVIISMVLPAIARRF